MMMRIFTARFSGAGRVDCRRCGHATVFPDSVKAVLYDDGEQMMVLDAEHLVELHRCGREFRWVCMICKTPREDRDPLPNIRTRNRTARLRVHPVLVCTECGGRMHQRQIVSPT